MRYVGGDINNRSSPYRCQSSSIQVVISNGGSDFEDLSDLASQDIPRTLMSCHNNAVCREGGLGSDASGDICVHVAQRTAIGVMAADKCAESQELRMA